MADLASTLAEAQRLHADSVFRKNAELQQSPRPRPVNFLGVGIGFKKRNGEATNVLSLRFYVRHKLAEKDTAPSELVPRYVDGIETDVVEVMPFVANAQTVSAVMPFAVINEPGMGIQYRTTVTEGPRGTMGAVLTDARGTRYALSANHVLAQNGSPFGLPGFCVVDTGQAASPVIAPAQMIGHKVTYAPLRNECAADCAMVEAEPGVVLKHMAPPQLANVSATPAAAVPGAEIAKSGNTTGFTRGRITDHFADIQLNCGSLGNIRVSQAILLEDDDPTNGSFDFSHPGDSGSLIFQRTDDGWAPMGLLIAGLKDVPEARTVEGLGAACSVTSVLDALNGVLEDRSRLPLRLAEFEAA